jgi:carbamate kinase
MRMVIGLGGTVLVHGNFRSAAETIASIAGENQIVIAHANTVQAEGLTSLLIERELNSLLPFGRASATILTMVEAAADDPASPRHIVEIRPIRWLLDRNTIVIAACGAMPDAPTTIDQDLASELLARELRADLFVMLTGADAVYVNWGRPSQAAIRRASPASLATWAFAAGSIGPKVEAACRFAAATGRKAAIGALHDLEKIVIGEAGTTISVAETGITYAGLRQLASRIARG